MSDIHDGGCLCGNVRYRTIGEPIMATIRKEPKIALTPDPSPGGEQKSACYLLEEGGERGKLQVRNLRIGPDTFFQPGRFPKPVAMAWGMLIP
jgi:hypothetical protein